MLQLPEEGSARVVFSMGLATLTIVAAAVKSPDQRSYSQIFKIVCTSSKLNTFHAKSVSF
jgi:hypothetical protein